MSVGELYLAAERGNQKINLLEKRLIRYGLGKKIQDYLGIVPNMGGGVFPKLKTPKKCP